MSMTTNKQTLRSRIEKALKDFTSGRASMHVPPLDTDVDMVLADCATALEAAERRNADLVEFLSHVKKCLVRNREYAPLSHEEIDTLLGIRCDAILRAAATDKGE